MRRYPGWQVLVIPGAIVLCLLVYQAIFGADLDARPSIVQCALKTDICDREFKIERDAAGGIIKAEFPIRNGSALVLYQNYGTAEAMLTNERNAVARAALLSFLRSNDLPRARQKKYVFIGTADLAEVQKSFDTEGVCIGKRQSSLNASMPQSLPPSAASNECLALMRAFYVGEVVSSLGIVRDGDFVEIRYDPTPMMMEANDRTEGELFKALDLRTVQQLCDELGISALATHAETGADKRLQELIKAKRGDYDKRLFPFRSVIVLALQCPDVNCAV